ncbi:DUF2892 domain-containing protein [Intrasporangium sp. DVR]|uniref:YgaP family membrane protein n=1 Tax=Intrasporangium sp. DVR TaxID=3127867 RepID=UPI00313A71EC
MKRNLGASDRLARAVLGVGALGWAAALGWSSTAAIVLLALAALLVVTAAAGFCPLYRLLGLSTYHPERTAAVPAGRTERTERAGQRTRH